MSARPARRRTVGAGPLGSTHAGPPSFRPAGVRPDGSACCTQVLPRRCQRARQRLAAHVSPRQSPAGTGRPASPGNLAAWRPERQASAVRIRHLTELAKTRQRGLRSRCAGSRSPLFFGEGARQPASPFHTPRCIGCPFEWLALALARVCRLLCRPWQSGGWTER